MAKEFSTKLTALENSSRTELESTKKELKIISIAKKGESSSMLEFALLENLNDDFFRFGSTIARLVRRKTYAFRKMFEFRKRRRRRKR